MKELTVKENDPKCTQAHNLILWNDNYHDMINVVVALSEVCHLTDKICITIMMEAHTKGRTVVKNGGIDDLLEMKKGLNRYGLIATVELA